MIDYVLSWVALLSTFSSVYIVYVRVQVKEVEDPSAEVYLTKTHTRKTRRTKRRKKLIIESSGTKSIRNLQKAN